MLKPPEPAAVRALPSLFPGAWPAPLRSRNRGPAAARCGQLGFRRSLRGALTREPCAGSTESRLPWFLNPRGRRDSLAGATWSRGCPWRMAQGSAHAGRGAQARGPAVGRSAAPRAAPRRGPPCAPPHPPHPTSRALHQAPAGSGDSSGGPYKAGRWLGAPPLLTPAGLAGFPRVGRRDAGRKGAQVAASGCGLLEHPS